MNPNNPAPITPLTSINRLDAAASGPPRALRNRLAETFAALRARRSPALVAYLTGGDPDVATSFALAEEIARAGADVLEIGVPFSDPLADGPTIQAAAGRALAAGATVERLFEGLREFRQRCETPVVLFTYLNPVYIYGFEAFHAAAASAGADGVLLLDLPPDEAERNQEMADTHGLDAIRLIAPTTPEARMAEICATASGFIYYVSREGVTGEQQALADTIGERVGLLQQHTALPICVGFGISSPEQAAEVGRLADGVVVGSAIVRRVAEWSGQADVVQRVGDFVRPLAEAVHAIQRPPR